MRVQANRFFSDVYTMCEDDDVRTHKRKGRNEGKHFSIWHHSTRRRYVDRGNATALVSVSARCSTVNITVLSLLRTLLCLSNDDFVVKRRKRDGTELNWKITRKKAISSNDKSREKVGKIYEFEWKIA